MKWASLRHSRGIAALLITAISLTVCYLALGRLSFYRVQIESRLREKTELATLRETLLSRRAAYEQISAMNASGESLASVVKRTLPGVGNDTVLRETRDAGEGWVVRQYDVRLDQVPPARLGEFLSACVNARPPLRVVEVQVSRSRESDGSLAAQLTLAEMSAAGLGSTP